MRMFTPFITVLSTYRYLYRLQQTITYFLKTKNYKPQTTNYKPQTKN